jgi:hypothetical protein
MRFLAEENKLVEGATTMLGVGLGEDAGRNA